MAAKLSVPFHPKHALDRPFPRLLIEKLVNLPGVTRVRQHGGTWFRPAFLAPDTSQHVAENSVIIPPA